MMELIYVVRHGRTALNAQDRFRGRADPPLDQVGHVEALTAARTLEDLGLLAVHTSPLRRALETAGPIAERAGVPVHVVLGLTDLDYGRWEGRTRVEAAAADPVAFERFLRDPVNATPPEGERVRNLVERARRSLPRADRAPLAIVTHELVLRALMTQARGGAAFWDEEIPTGSVWAVAVDARSRGVVRLTRTS
jgi:broad specificity phosphatase PhoE